jgi:hypothetical protein
VYHLPYVLLYRTGLTPGFFPFTPCPVWTRNFALFYEALDPNKHKERKLQGHEWRKPMYAPRKRQPWTKQPGASGLNNEKIGNL